MGRSSQSASEESLSKGPLVVKLADSDEAEQQAVTDDD